ncbi:MAG: hypothetical protein K1X75_08270 [Leptospirales bacterium]|nr:hypothetical protein [Leptospirales bacterium]
MKLRNSIAGAVLAFGWTALFSQSSQAPDETSGAPAPSSPAAQQEKPAGSEEQESPSYLDLHIASERNQRLNAILSHDTARLDVLVHNFGARLEGGRQSLEKIQTLHTEGMALHYRRRYIEALQKLDEARKESLALYKKSTELFRKQSDDILNEAALAIASGERHLLAQASSPPQAGQDFPNSNEISRARHHLQNAYGELNAAESLERDSNYDIALDHLRLGRLFAIHALLALQDAPAKREELERRFAVEIADSNGRLASSVAQGQTAPQ